MDSASGVRAADVCGSGRVTRAPASAVATTVLWSGNPPRVAAVRDCGGICMIHQMREKCCGDLDQVPKVETASRKDTSSIAFTAPEITVSRKVAG